MEFDQPHHDYLRYLTLLLAVEEWAPLWEVERQVEQMSRFASAGEARRIARNIVEELIRDGFVRLVRSAGPGKRNRAVRLPDAEVLDANVSWSKPVGNATMVVLEATPAGEVTFVKPGYWNVEPPTDLNS